MRTVLQHNEELDEFKEKSSILQVVLLEQKVRASKASTASQSTPVSDEKKIELTGKEIDIGKTPLNLAEFAKDELTTKKLYIQGFDDMYIEIQVKCKPGDPQIIPLKKPEP